MSLEWLGHQNATLLDEVAALDPSQRREVAAALRKVADTFAKSSVGGSRVAHPESDHFFTLCRQLTGRVAFSSTRRSSGRSSTQ
jgi:hypothetical protein